MADDDLTVSFSRLKHLERLDLFRAGVKLNSILILLQNNRNLKHLNMCNSSIHMDKIAIQLSETNLEIKSIDLWKSVGLSSIGLMALSKCTKLEEIDFGWW